MPLYWYTDKPIGKYRLKKPIPVEVNIEQYEGGDITMFGLNVFDYERNIDEFIIEEILRLMGGNFSITVNGDRWCEDRETNFLLKIKECLEEI